MPRTVSWSLAKGGMRVSITKSVQPRRHMSVGTLGARLDRSPCSGGMYMSCTTRPSASWLYSVKQEQPKSISLRCTSPDAMSPMTIAFSGLMSEWMTPVLWRCCMASVSCRKRVRAFDELHEHEYHGLGLDDALVADDPRVRTHLGAVSAEIILDARALVLVLELVDLQREVHAAGQVRAPEGAVPALADFVTPRGLEHVQHVVIDRAERDLVHGKTFRTAEARLRAVLREGALSCIRERLQALHALHDALDLALCPAGLLHALLGLGLPLLHLILELLLRRLLLVVDLFQAIHQALQLPLPCFHVRGAVGLQASDLLLQL
mmetsp:Transcript_5176/g.16721  ORF Transcript_5176/g.16721 Transcript_5176/m.16721 type:complete len:321 (+) Transcript_5176:194-1156(+)